jgi:RHS repeat-associated protein
VGGVTTQYLVSEVNPTGLSQVVDEIVAGTVQENYTYGLQRISQDRVVSGAIVPSFYSYDGHGDVRLLTCATGAATDTYEYDSYGNLVSSTGSTPNVFLYQGEQFDSETGFYYLRARYYNPATGRFLSVDPAMGPDDDAGSAHAYLYAGANPVDNADPSGEDFGVPLLTQLVEPSILLQPIPQSAGSGVPSGPGPSLPGPPGPIPTPPPPPPNAPCWADPTRINQTLNDLGQNILGIAGIHGIHDSSLETDVRNDVNDEENRIDPFADAANASLLEYSLQDIQVFNGGHFNLVLPLTSVPSRTFARTFGGPPLVGSAIGAHNSAVYGNPAQGHYTMHSHEKTLKLYNFHFDKYDPTDILRFQWVPHLFGEVIGGHPTGSVCLDPAWASQ